MPFQKITSGSHKGKYRSPSGRIFTFSQVRRYHARGGTFDAKPTRRDPTGTIGIQRSLDLLISRAWKDVKKKIKMVVVEADSFGIASHGPGQVAAMAATGGPVTAFGYWMESVLGKFQSALVEPLKSTLVMAYNLGSNQALEMATGPLSVPTPLTGPGNLFAAALADLRGVVEAVLQQSTRLFANSLVPGTRPVVLGRTLSILVERIGQTRSVSLSNHYVVSANAHGRLDLLQSLGIHRVGVVPEAIGRDHTHDAPVQLGTVRLRVPSLTRRPKASPIARAAAIERRMTEMVNIQTAGDDRVCPVCDKYSRNGPYSIDYIRPLYPFHNLCRCGLTPA